MSAKPLHTFVTDCNISTVLAAFSELLGEATARRLRSCLLVFICLRYGTRCISLRCVSLDVFDAITGTEGGDMLLLLLVIVGATGFGLRGGSRLG